jgi:hypothetical protein
LSFCADHAAQNCKNAPSPATGRNTTFENGVAAVASLVSPTPRPRATRCIKVPRLTSSVSKRPPARFFRSGGCEVGRRALLSADQDNLVKRPTATRVPENGTQHSEAAGGGIDAVRGWRPQLGRPDFPFPIHASYSALNAALASSSESACP